MTDMPGKQILRKSCEGETETHARHEFGHAPGHAASFVSPSSDGYNGLPVAEISISPLRIQPLTAQR